MSFDLGFVILLYLIGYFLVKWRKKIEQDYYLKEKEKQNRWKMFEDGGGI